MAGMTRRLPPPSRHGRFFARLLFGLALAMGVGGTAVASCPLVSLDPSPLPALRAALGDGQPITIVALGSSSTRGAGASGEAASYPARLEAALRRALPDIPLRVINRGIGGQDAAEMLARLDTDVIAERPQLVIWQAGGNSALRGHDPARIATVLREGIARLRQIGADLMLMDNQRAPRIVAAPGAPRFEAMMVSLAASERVALFPRGRLMDAWAASGVPHAALLVEDGLHHNDRGYACIAEALAQSVIATLLPGPGEWSVSQAER